MKFKTFLVGLFLFLIPLVFAVPSPVGDWHGTLTPLGGEIRVQFQLKQTGEGQYAGTMDNLDAGILGLALDSVTIEGESLILKLDRFDAKYEGIWNEEAKEWRGEWIQSGQTIPLTLRYGLFPKPKRPQMPQAPFPYREEEVTYRNPKSGLKLAGTLALPKGQGPFPTAVLITGSGPQDGNQTLFDHKPFWVISDYLARRGIAVLRVDDRGVGGSEGTGWGKSTSADFATDVEAGVTYLRTRKEIASIGLIGHSEGGLIAPIVAAKDPKISWIVLLAGPGIRGDKLLVLQNRVSWKDNAFSPEMIDKLTNYHEQIYATLIAEQNAPERKEKVRALLTTISTELKMPGASTESQLQLLLMPWFRFFLSYDPATNIRKLNCAVLALNGEKDHQVTPKENLAGIRKALRGRPNVEIRELPSLNHLFQTAETGALAEYARIEETFSPLALRAIEQWIQKQIQASRLNF